MVACVLQSSVLVDSRPLSFLASAFGAQQLQPSLSPTTTTGTGPGTGAGTGSSVACGALAEFLWRGARVVGERTAQEPGGPSMEGKCCFGKRSATPLVSSELSVTVYILSYLISSYLISDLT